MESPAVTCAACGADLLSAYVTAGAEREPCRACGATGIAVSLAVADEIDVADSLSWSTRTTNTAAARKRQLESALADVEQAVDGGSVSDAQDALKRALEAMHELSDCLKRGEWVQAGWTADDLAVWHAHIGARNAAHHTSSALAPLHSHGTRDERLTWDIEQRAIASLPSPRQAGEYNARLAGQPVLPNLRAMVVRVSDAVA